MGTDTTWTMWLCSHASAATTFLAMQQEPVKVTAIGPGPKFSAAVPIPRHMFKLRGHRLVKRIFLDVSGINEFDDISRASTKLLTRIDTLQLISEKAFNISGNLNNTGSHNESDTSRTLDINNPGGLNLVFIFDSSGSVGKQGFATAKKFASTLVQHVRFPSPEGVHFPFFNRLVQLITHFRWASAPMVFV